MAIRVLLTVEEMLVLLVVIKVTAVLLDLVDAEDAGVDVLCTQAVVLKLAVDLTLLLAVGVLDPDALDVSALDDVIPLGVVLASVRLGVGEEGGLVHLLRVHHGDLIPDGAGLASEGLEALLEIVQRLCPRAGVKTLERFRSLEDLLLWDGSGRCSKEQGRGSYLHGGVRWSFRSSTIAMQWDE